MTIDGECQVAFSSRVIDEFGIGALITPAQNYLAGWSGADEQGLVDVVTRHLPATGTFLDIGANIGLTGMIVSALKPDAHVIAVEAAPTMAEIARQNFAAKRLAVEMHNAAAGASVGSTYFIEAGPYGHMVSEAEAQTMRNLITVPMKPADSIVAGRRVDIIKIDVEGFERNVIEGCSEIEKLWQPGYYVEFNLWTLMMYGRINPMEFLEYLQRKFRYAAYLMDGYWQVINDVSRDHVIWRGMKGHLDNIFVCNDPQKAMT